MASGAARREKTWEESRFEGGKAGEWEERGDAFPAGPSDKKERLQFGLLVSGLGFFLLSKCAEMHNVPLGSDSARLPLSLHLLYLSLSIYLPFSLSEAVILEKKNPLHSSSIRFSCMNIVLISDLYVPLREPLH